MCYPWWYSISTMPWRHKRNTSDIPTSGTNAPPPRGGIKRLRTSNHELPSPHLLHPCVCLQSGNLESEIFIWPDRSDEILHLFIAGWWRAAWRGIIPCWHNAFCFGTLSLSNLNCVLVPSSAQCWGFMRRQWAAWPGSRVFDYDALSGHNSFCFTCCFLP